MKCFNWCIFKLDFYVTLFRAINILVVANDNSHMGIKLISWSWRVGGVTKTSGFSYHI